jgi:hypothetical protein
LSYYATNANKGFIEGPSQKASQKDDRPSVIGRVSASASSVLGGISKLATSPMNQKLIDARNILKDNMTETIVALNKSKRNEPTRANSPHLQNWGPKIDEMKHNLLEEYNAACDILKNPDTMTTIKAATPFISPQALANHVMNMVKDSHPHLIKLYRANAAAAKAHAAAKARAAADDSSDDSDHDGGKKKSRKSRKNRKTRSRKNRKTRSRK